MNPDELKQAWRASGGKLTIDADVLITEVRRNEDQFNWAIFRRDLTEVGGSLIMVVVWFYLGARYELPWTWYLGVPALLWIAGFMLIDRMRQKQRQPRMESSLGECIAGSLAEVEHQIWLLRNVFWWYLLPPSIAVLSFFGQVAWEARDGGWRVAAIMAGCVTFELALTWGIYWLNQYAVREDLEPRRKELLKMVDGLHPGGGTVADPAASTRVTRSAQDKSMNWKSMFWIGLLGIVTAGLSALAYQAGKPEAAPFDPKFSPAAGDPAVTNVLVPIRQKHEIPAMAAAVLTSKGIVWTGVTGTRKQGTNIAATLEDKWHLGSETKSMNATLIARLVEQGRLKWTSTVADVFPDMAAGFHPDARGITVVQLLAHHSGLPANPDLIKYGGPDGTQERLRVVRDYLAKAPEAKPGKRALYSNLGYSIAGAMAEKVTGKSWEQAMLDEVFRPLGMTTVGFGGTGTPGQIDQPWGHSGNGKPVDGNGPRVDNPPVLSPAGRVHCTIQDWAKYLGDQLRGARGEPGLLKPDSYRILHARPFEGDYALGWIAVNRPWGGGIVLNHCGDNTMNFANAWIAPKRDFAILVCLNRSGDAGFNASDAAVGALIQAFSARGDDSRKN